MAAEALRLNVRSAASLLTTTLLRVSFVALLAAPPAWADLEPDGELLELSRGSHQSSASNLRGDWVAAWTENNEVHAQAYESSGQPRGNPIVIPTFGTYQPSAAEVAMDAMGNFALAWRYESPILPTDPFPEPIQVQMFDSEGRARGDRLLPFVDLPATTGLPVLAMDAHGGLVVAVIGTEGGGRETILMRTFDSQGEPRGGTSRIDLPVGSQRTRPQIALDPQGRIAVVWGRYGCDAFTCFDFRVIGRVFDADGQPLGREVFISESGIGSSVAWHPRKGFTAIWYRPPFLDYNIGDPTVFAVWGQSFDEESRVGLPFVIEREREGSILPRETFFGLRSQLTFSVDLLGNGLVVWQSDNFSRDSSTLLAQSLDSELRPEGPRLELTPGESLRSRFPVAVATGPGRFLVTWTSRELSEPEARVVAQGFRRAEQPCGADQTRLCLQGGRFEVTGSYETPSGVTGPVRFVTLSDDSSYVWFFQPNNVEALVKVLDGRPVNDHFWVFSGGLSNVEYSLNVRDSSTGEEKVYTNPQGNFSSFGDVAAFFDPTEAPLSQGEAVDLSIASSSSGPRQENRAPASAPAPEAGRGGCVPDSQSLCFLDRRFQVKVSREGPRGELVPAQVVPLTDQTGAFWFGNRNNLELIVKVHDGRVVNDKFWVFWGAATHQRYLLTVTDTVSQEVWSRENPAGTFASGADTGAF
ncbi:MAG: hypothetical protein K0U98_13930 [Deltaproteobacteria bacterium]|nr:hypothetical protein [Deltaproteobacteria bacterium]